MLNELTHGGTTTAQSGPSYWKKLSLFHENSLTFSKPKLFGWPQHKFTSFLRLTGNCNRFGKIDLGNSACRVLQIGKMWSCALSNIGACSNSCRLARIHHWRCFRVKTSKLRIGFTASNHFLAAVVIFCIDVCTLTINSKSVKYCHKRFEKMHGKATLNARYQVLLTIQYLVVHTVSVFLLQVREAYEVASSMQKSYIMCFFCKVLLLVFFEKKIVSELFQCRRNHIMCRHWRI